MNSLNYNKIKNNEQLDLTSSNTDKAFEYFENVQENNLYVVCHSHIMDHIIKKMYNDFPKKKFGLFGGKPNVRERRRKAPKKPFYRGDFPSKASFYKHWAKLKEEQEHLKKPFYHVDRRPSEASWAKLKEEQEHPEYANRDIKLEESMNHNQNNRNQLQNKLQSQPLKCTKGNKNKITNFETFKDFYDNIRDENMWDFQIMYVVDDINVLKNITFIRHAFSVANIYNERAKKSILGPASKNKIDQIREKDAKLSLFGILSALKMSQKKNIT